MPVAAMAQSGRSPAVIILYTRGRESPIPAVRRGNRPKIYPNHSVVIFDDGKTLVEMGTFTDEYLASFILPGNLSIQA